MFLNTISNQKLQLRPFLKLDLETWMEWDLDPDVQRYMPERYSKEVTYESQEEFFNESESAEDEIHAAIVDAASGELVGTISLTDIDENEGTGELGIVIGNKAYWGKGYATEAIDLFLSEIKNTKRVKRILAEFETENIAVRKALENNGFQLEALSEKSRMKNNQPIDTFRYIKRF